MQIKILLHAAVLVAVSSPGSAGIIYHDSQTWSGEKGHFVVTTTFWDNFRGDFTKEEWQYSVQNINFAWQYGKFPDRPLSFEGIAINLDNRYPAPPFFGLGDFYGPAGWDQWFWYSNLMWTAPGEWGSSLGIKPGATGTFGFSVARIAASLPFTPIGGPSGIGISQGVAFSLCIPPGCGIIPSSQDAFGRIAVPVPILQPAIPEPATLWFATTGALLFTLLKRVRIA